MLPLLALAVTFGGITCWMIHRTMSISSDRGLVASVAMIGRAISARDSVRDNLLPLAVHLLPSRSMTTLYFSIYDGDHLLAGTSWLTPPADYLPQSGVKTVRHEPAFFPRRYGNRRLMRDYLDAREAGDIIQPAYLRSAKLEGRPVRIATEIRVLHRPARPVAMQVAEFLDEEQAYEQTYFLRVLGAGILIVMIAVLLFYGAITWGLRPFASLTDQIDSASRHPVFRPRLSLAHNVPREARMLATAFNELMERSERAIDALRQFTANASHQLRTPLAIMRVHVDVLTRYGPDSRQGATALVDIAAAVEGLERLLSQLISLARMDEQCRASERMNDFDLANVAAKIVADRVTHTDARRMDIGFDARVLPVMACGDAMLAAEMIANLLDNAIRYNRPDGTVTVRTLYRDTVPIVEIEDDGPGIAPADRDRVWERFYRAPGADAPPGSGLGLPIVRALGERMGARVTLSEGKAGKGVNATVAFQQAQAPAANATASNVPSSHVMTAY